MPKQAVIVFGPPGGGKGTQAELLEKRHNFVHFDSGRFFENLFKSPEAKKDPVLKREKCLFDTGELMSPAFALRTSTAAVKRIGLAGDSIVFSGSPRTEYEAFGDKRHQGLLKTIEGVYGKKNVSIVELKVKPRTSLKRNGARRVCGFCGLPVLASAKTAICAFCAGKTRRRTLDKPTVIKERLKEYARRTQPMIARMRRNGYRIIPVNGELLPYKISEGIAKKLHLA